MSRKRRAAARRREAVRTVAVGVGMTVIGFPLSLLIGVTIGDGMARTNYTADLIHAALTLF